MNEKKTVPPSFAEFTAGPDDNGRRIDRVVRKLLRTAAMSEIYRSFRKEQIKLNGKKAAPDAKISCGDLIWIHRRLLPDAAETQTVPPATEQSGILARITIFKNSNLLIINKPHGMPVHGGGALRDTETADDLVKQDYAAAIKENASLSFIPGPLHRLDRNTSGLTVFSQSLKGAAVFSELIRNHSVVKQYLGIIEGNPEKAQWNDTVSRDTRLKISAADPDGQETATEVQPLASNGKTTLALFTIHTGRTHQIRVQCAIHRCPLRGDRKYGSTVPSPRYFLHAWKLVFPRNCTLFTAGDALPEPPVFTAPLPHEFAAEITAQFGADLLVRLNNRDL